MSSATSPAPMSLSLPTETSFAKVKPRAMARESSAPIMLPLCDTTLSQPGRSASASTAALFVIGTPSVTFTRPRQFGPISRSPPSRAMATMRSCLVRPSAPSSAKPALKRVATFTPFATQPAMASGTAADGTMMKAWSIGPGAWRMSG